MEETKLFWQSHKLTFWKQGIEWSADNLTAPLNDRTAPSLMPSVSRESRETHV